MNRSKFISKAGKKTTDGRLEKYQEACRLFKLIETSRELLEHMGGIFNEVEDKINKALVDLPLYDLAYDFVGDSAEAFTHNGPKMTVSFVLRNTNTTTLYTVKLKTQDIFELTNEELINTIKKHMIRR